MQNFSLFSICELLNIIDHTRILNFIIFICIKLHIHLYQLSKISFYSVVISTILSTVEHNTEYKGIHPLAESSCRAWLLCAKNRTYIRIGMPTVGMTVGFMRKQLSSNSHIRTFTVGLTVGFVKNRVSTFVY